MRLPILFYSFRTRLLLVLALLLIATLGVQYYLNSRAEKMRGVRIAEQEQALAASIELALDSITTPTSEYLWQLDEKRPVSFLKAQGGRVQNVLVVNEQGRIDDSLVRQYAPRTLEDGTAQYWNVRDIQLPRLVESGQTASDIRHLRPDTAVPQSPLVAGEPRAFPIPVRTSDGVNYIIVVLGAARPTEGSSWAGMARPYLPTLAVLLLATMAAGVLVWRFTRPIKELSTATQRVAAGDFSFRVPSSGRRDEIGALVPTFNEMIAGLSRTRELEAQVKVAEHSAVVVRLASAIAHEIRNPLNYINLTLDHLRTSLAPADPEKRAVVERLTAQLKSEVQRINTRISEFLKYTRPARLELKSLDLRETVADALRMVEVQATESNIETKLEADAALPHIVGDREALRSVFTNLIINGMQAMEGTGGRLTIKLSATDEGRHARVQISDTGRGIAPDNVSKIFEPYYSTKETGTGLGLAIVRKAIEEHNGTISVESQQGAGTTFIVELPTGGSDK